MIKICIGLANINMLVKFNIPNLTDKETDYFFSQAYISDRKRYPKILHKKGDKFNRVFNFLLNGTYMQPHLHPGFQKKEKMYVVYGSFDLIFFNKKGKVEKKILLDHKINNYYEVPPFKWHTYIVRSKKAIVYETMIGRYKPETWKKMASWAPKEIFKNAEKYLMNLKLSIIKKKNA